MVPARNSKTKKARATLLIEDVKSSESFTIRTHLPLCTMRLASTKSCPRKTVVPTLFFVPSFAGCSAASSTLCLGKILQKSQSPTCGGCVSLQKRSTSNPLWMQKRTPIRIRVWASCSINRRSTNAGHLLRNSEPSD